MTRTLEEQGFVKHDGSGMPDCYEDEQVIDVVWQMGFTQTCAFKFLAPSCWPTISHHRRHISERQQLDMAIEALEDAEEWLQGWASAEGELAHIESTLKTLKERQP